MYKFLIGATFSLAFAGAFAGASSPAVDYMMLADQDPIVPIVDSDTEIQRRAGVLYYDVGVGLKIVNPSGAIETISVTGGSPVTSSGASERIERIKYYTTSFGTVCSVSTCDVTSSSTGISVTRNSLGNYTINFPVGMWSSAPTCVIYPANNTNTVIPFNTGLIVTATAYQFKTNDTISAGLLNTFGDILCMGSR